MNPFRAFGDFNDVEAAKASAAVVPTRKTRARKISPGESSCVNSQRDKITTIG